MKPTSPEENLDLKAIIFDRIRHQGSIPFSEFMELCLYHPVHGYYQTTREKIGKEGDYYTSPSVHPVFGRLLARQLKEMGDLVGGDPFWVVEAGAGRGTLAKDILDCLVEESPEFFGRVRYGIIERSPSFIEEQTMRLAPHEGKVDWLDLEEVPDESLQGCFVSNEFFDALPSHRVVVRNGTLREIYVTVENGVLCEVFEESSTLAVRQYLDNMEVRLVEGQQAEVNLEAIRWLDQVARVLCRGFLLTIDYGYLAEDLYAVDRRWGTLLCYYRHTCSEDPYAHIGLQDMTTHVNFTGLIKRGDSLGFHLAGLVPQYQFLLSLGFLEEIERLNVRDLPPQCALTERLAMKHLILPDGGMGDTFKVLIQHRGVGDIRLRGLRAL